MEDEKEKLIQVAVGLLNAAVCPCCDGSGAYYDDMGAVCQCQWCYEVEELNKKVKNND